MMKQGYSLEFKDNICTIYDQQDVELLCVKMKSKSFKLDWEAIEKQAYFETVLSDSNLWHKRFGHFNHRSLSYVKNQNLHKIYPKSLLNLMFMKLANKENKLNFHSNKIKVR